MPHHRIYDNKSLKLQKRFVTQYKHSPTPTVVT